MHRLKKGDNPTIYGAQVRFNEKEKSIEIPPKKSTIGIAPSDVEQEPMKLTSANSYTFKEMNGKVYRVSDKEIEYPPMTKERYNTLQQERKQSSGRKTEDNREI